MSGQATLDMQLMLTAFGARDNLRAHADAAMLADLKRLNRGARGKSIVVHRKVAHQRQWYACLLCPWQSRPWSSATNPPPKWAQKLRDAHRARHCDEWLAERGYAIPGEDAALDLVLGDALFNVCCALGPWPDDTNRSTP